MNTLRMFTSQRNRAKQRGIEWQLTYEQWLQVWQESGHLEHRGTGSGQYVMARRGDIGPYAPGNVYICTGAQNAADASANGCYAHARDGRQASEEALAANRHTRPVQFQWAVVRMAQTYREAVRLSWRNRRLPLMTLQQLAAEAKLIPQHASDYLAEDDKTSRRDLPADAIARFEAAVGNTIVSQWLAARSGLTVLQAERAAA